MKLGLIHQKGKSSWWRAGGERGPMNRVSFGTVVCIGSLRGVSGLQGGAQGSQSSGSPTGTSERRERKGSRVLHIHPSAWVPRGGVFFLVWVDRCHVGVSLFKMRPF